MKEGVKALGGDETVYNAVRSPLEVLTFLTPGGTASGLARTGSKALAHSDDLARLVPKALKKGEEVLAGTTKAAAKVESKVGNVASSTSSGIKGAEKSSGTVLQKYKTPKSGSGKEKATDIPSWSEGQKPYANENGKDFATRLMNEKYGEGNWSRKSPEYSKLQKNGDRGYQ